MRHKTVYVGRVIKCVVYSSSKALPAIPSVTNIFGWYSWRADKVSAVHLYNLNSNYRPVIVKIDIDLVVEL